MDDDLAVCYSSDGINWNQHPVGVEVSGYQHNILGDFAALEIAVYCKGAGELKVHNFRYRAIE